ncbi:MAG TPA: MbcA/ParS/Xre antitoxin family protein [Nitrospira sp.]
MKWLTMVHGQAVRKALDSGFFGSLDKDEYDLLPDPHDDAFRAIMTNAMEWLLADGVMTIKGEERRVSDMLLGRGGPLFSVEQRQWIELLAASPLRLYEVVETKPGECMTLRDVLLPEHTSVLVREKSGSRQVARFDLIAARIISVKDDFELSGAVYLFPRDRSWELLEELRHELESVAPDSLLAKKATSSIIPRHWLMLCIDPVEIPQVLDHVTREPILFITDHYRVQDWEALDLALSGEVDVGGTRKNGWYRIFEGEDGLERSSVSIDVAESPDRIKVVYRTQKYADEGRPWFDAIAGAAVTFVSREISHPKGVLANSQAEDEGESQTLALLPPGLTPEIATAILEERIRQYYANWADEPLPILGDRTPREAIQTDEGLEQVKFLLRTYEHGEAQQAKAQHHMPVSYDFLWQSVGITS